jgi:DUF4097 and DUF4098 domain-containing protein YvlB
LWRPLVSVALTCLFFLGTVQSQAPLPPAVELERAKREPDIILDERARQTADEYLDVLEQLENILNDYSIYLSRLNDSTLDLYRISLEEFAEGIEDGSYSEDAENLVRSIHESVKRLSEQEAAIEAPDDAEDRKLQQLIRNLRKDLTIINVLIEEDIAPKLEEYREYSDQIKVYLRTAIENREIEIAGITRDPRSARGSVEGTEAKGQVEAPTGRAGLIRKYRDSIRISSEYTPIYISHPVGDVVIDGNRINELVAELEIQISAAGLSSEKHFVAATALRIEEKDRGYYVESVFPKLTDPETSILRSTLHVEVPVANRVACDNSFGKVQAYGLESGLMIKGSYSTITIVDVSGKVRVENTMGSVDIASTSGSINVFNSGEEVALTECRGNITIKNEGGIISLSDSEGDAKLTNTGKISVLNHSGEVSIENNNGEVKVLNLVGDLTAFNSFQPLVIQYVDGLVWLENTNSAIRAYQVSGSLEANNRFGPIVAEGVAGPIIVAGQDGNITVSLNDRLTGPSSVSTLSGHIDVSLPDDIDILLTAVSEGGDISSSFPISIIGSNHQKSGTIKLGAGTEVLALSAKNASIEIKKTR